MRNINIYCGWQRKTIVKTSPKIVDDIVFEIPCLECGGTGIWEYFIEEESTFQCTVCKGTGKQYLGL